MDYLIAEAVALKVMRQDREAEDEMRKKSEMDQKKKDAKEKLKQMFG